MAARFWQRLPAGPRQKSLLRRWKRFVEVFGRSPQRRDFDWIAIFNEAQRAALYSDEFLAALPDADPREFLAAAFAASRRRDPVTAASLADLVTYCRAT